MIIGPTSNGIPAQTIDDIVTSIEANEIDEVEDENNPAEALPDIETNETDEAADEDDPAETAPDIETDEDNSAETPPEELEKNTMQLISPASFVIVMDETELVTAIDAGITVIILGADIYISGSNLYIPAGANITLEGDFVLSRTNIIGGNFITVGSNASLTIDGVRIEAPAGAADLRGIFVNDDAELVLADGSISGFDHSNGAGVCVMDGNFVMYSGTIYENSGLSAAGGVAIYGGQFTMYGGEIRGNTVSSHGAGVFVSDGNFTMHGGEIHGNFTDNGSVGGGVCISSGSFEMHDGVISGNGAENGSGVFLWSSNFVMYDGEISGNSNLAHAGMSYAGGVSVQESTFEMRGGTISGNNAEMGGGVFVDHGSFEMYHGNISGNNAGDGGGILASHSSIEIHNGTINGNDANNGGGMFVAGEWTSIHGSLIMHGGEISDNSATNHGGGVYLLSAKFDMWDGKINNNTVEYGYGGGIILDSDGIFDMHNGEISGNHGIWGGGVATHGGKIVMYDGKITNNTAELGGGIKDEFFWLPNISAIYGGEVSGNTAELGGGIYVEQGAPFVISNAIISGNTADFGGGTYVVDSASLDVTGSSSITNNNAQSGGGIYTMDVGDYSNLIAADYQNITTANTVVFSGNSASAAYEPPPNTGVTYPNIQYASSSIQVAGAYWNPINNFDINYMGETPAYFVRYFANGGTGTHADMSTENTEYTVLSDTETGVNRTSHIFAGWNTEADGSGTSYVAGDTITITSNVNLYAQWTPALQPSLSQYLVRYFANGGTGTRTNVSLRNTTHTVLSNTAAGISRAGYNFVNWNTEANGSGTSYTAGDAIIVSSNVNLYAQWVYAPYSPESSPSNSRPPQHSPTPTPPSQDLSTLPELALPSLPSTQPYRHAYLIGTEGRIHPNTKITRAEVATIFFRLMSDDVRKANWSQTNPYSDVAIENWFNNAISTTTQFGIFRGRQESTFAPTKSITRAELAAAAARFMNIAQIPDVEEDLFSDIHGHWANAYINMAAMYNWVQGYNGQGGKFYPDYPVTRAETVAVINRVFGRLPQSAADLLPDMITWPDNMDIGAWYYLYIQAASNSYTFEIKPGDVYEHWIALIPRRNWSILERPYSTPASLYSHMPLKQYAITQEIFCKTRS